MSDTHCDEVIEDYSYPDCLRYYLLVNRLPASEKCVVVNMVGEPQCFADYNSKRVRLVMASRFGDVGITYDLKAERGYINRVAISSLSNFNDKE